MAVNALSQINQRYIKSPKTNDKTRHAKLDLTQKTDSVELRPKNSEQKNKTEKYIEIALAGSCLVAGTLALLRSKNVPEEVKSIEMNAKAIINEAKNLSEEVKNLAREIRANAQKIKNEVNEIILNNGKNDGGHIVNIIKDKDITTVEELGKDGLPTRISTFYNDKHAFKIEVKSQENKDTWDIYKFDADENLSSYIKDCKEFDDECYKIKKMLNFEEDEMFLYTEGCEKNKNLCIKIEKQMSFKNDKPICFIKGKNVFLNEAICEKMLSFENAKVSGYLENYRIYKRKNDRVEKMLGFKNGKINDYTEGYEELSDGTNISKKKIVRSGFGKWNVA